MMTMNTNAGTRPRARRSAGGASAVLLLTLTGRDPLTNEVRRRIHEYVQENPGAHLRAIARALGLDTNQAKYHLVHLEQCGLVTGHRIYGHCAFYPGGDKDRDMEEDALEKAHLFLLRKKVPARIAARLLESGEATHAEIQKAVGVSASTLYYHLRRLEDQEVLTSRKIRRNQYWRLKWPSLCQKLLEEAAVQALLLKTEDAEAAEAVSEEEEQTSGRDFSFPFLRRRR